MFRVDAPVPPRAIASSPVVILPALKLVKLDPSPTNSVACTFVPTMTLPVVVMDSAVFVKLVVSVVTFPWVTACCSVATPAVFDNNPPSPKKNLLFPTVTLPDVSKETFVFVSVILFDAVPPAVVTCWRLPTEPPTPDIFDKPPPSPWIWHYLKQYLW